MRLPLKVLRGYTGDFVIVFELEFDKPFDRYVVYSSLMSKIDNYPYWNNGFWWANDYFQEGDHLYKCQREYWDNREYYMKEAQKLIVKEML